MKYLYFYKRENISKKYKIFIFIFVVIIIVSTLLTKQHYFIDCVLGIAISYISYLLVKKINPSKHILKEGLDN